MDINAFFYQLDQYFEEKEMEKAETYMKSCLADAEMENDAPSVIAICNELGGYYRAISRFHDGVILYEKALALLKGLNMTESEAFGTTLLNYATTCTIAGEKEKALSLYQQAAAIFRGPAYAADYRLATLYNNMSFLYQDLGQLKEAETYLEQALYILRALDESEIETAVTYTNLALVYMAEERLEEAKVTIKKALDIFLKETDGQDVHYSAAVCALGEIYYQEGQYEKAASLFETSMQLTERDYGADTLNYAILCENLAQCEEKTGKLQAAADHRKLAASIRERLAV